MSALVELNPELRIGKAIVAKPQNRFLVAFGSAFIFFNPLNIGFYLICVGIMFLFIGFAGGLVFLWALPLYFVLWVLFAYLFLTLFVKVT